MTWEALENAITVDMAIGGSTNAVVHLLAIPATVLGMVHAFQIGSDSAASYFTRGLALLVGIAVYPVSIRLIGIAETLSYPWASDPEWAEKFDALAREHGVPAYVIFHDATLREMLTDPATGGIDFVGTPDSVAELSCWKLVSALG